MCATIWMSLENIMLAKHQEQANLQRQKVDLWLPRADGNGEQVYLGDEENVLMVMVAQL